MRMLSPSARQWMTALLLAMIVGWWMPKIMHPPRVLPTPVKDFIEAYAPPHLDPDVKPEQLTVVAEPKVAEKPKKQSPALVKYAVQIGSFKVLTQIQSTIDDLKTQGYTVVVHPVDLDGKKLYRIWVGSLDSRAAAKNLQAELKTRFKLQGFVLKLGDL